MLIISHYLSYMLKYKGDTLDRNIIAFCMLKFQSCSLYWLKLEVLTVFMAIILKEFFRSIIFLADSQDRPSISDYWGADSRYPC